MKFTTVFTFLTISAVGVYAVHYETNASRFARGLPPLPPVRRSSTWSARRARPSSTPGKPRNCDDGQDVQCCNTVTSAANQHASGVAGPLNIPAPVTGLVGFGCSPLSVVGVGGNSCASQPVCCENNHSSGVVSTGCMPVNINT